MSCCKTYDPCLDGKLNQIGSYSAAARYAAEQSATSATQSANSATASATSATNSATSATQANNYLTQVENIFEDFDERYLGSKAVAPTVDNQGNPLQEGAIYWNSVANSLYVWDGSVWVALPTGFNEFTPFLSIGSTTPRSLEERFADVAYLGSFATPPTVDNNNAPLQVGSLYLNSGNNVLYRWDGSNWMVLNQLMSSRNIGIGAFFTGSVDSITTPKRKISLFTTTDGVRINKLNGWPLTDINDNELLGNDPSISFFNGFYHIAVGEYSTDNYDVVIYRSKNLIDWETFYVKYGTTGIRKTNGSAPGYATTFAPGPALWAPEWLIDGNNVYLISSIQCNPNFVDDDGNSIEYLRPFIAQCTNQNSLVFASPTELNVGGTVVSGPTLPKIDATIFKHGSVYQMFIKNEYNKLIERWTNSSISGAWTYIGNMAFPKYSEGPSVYVRYGSTNTYIIYADNYYKATGDPLFPFDSTSTMLYIETNDFTTFGSVQNITTATRIRHGGFINMVNNSESAYSALAENSFLTKGSFDQLAYGVAKAWVAVSGVTASSSTVLNSFNIQSVTRTAQGIFEINLIEPLLPFLGAVFISSDTASTGALTNKIVFSSTTNLVVNFFLNGTTTYADPNTFYFVAFGN